MALETELGEKSEEWFNKLLPKLRYEQDYSICFGHSKDMLDDEGKQKGIHIRRPFIRLFSTGIEKIYQMVVLGEELTDVKYTKEEEKALDKKIEAAAEDRRLLCALLLLLDEDLNKFTK